MDLINDLRKLVREDQISNNHTILEHHSRDESYHNPQFPQVVVFPETVADVQGILSYANDHQVPVTPFAVGSSLEGQVVPVRGGISLDMMRMNEILEVRPEDFLVRVQPGVTKEQLNAELARHGLFFSVDPGADATIGGMAATNASGTTTVRYGVMRDQVRSIQVVLPSGRVIETGSMAAKSASGLNLTGLFVGSEGTLGVFTEFWLKVYGLPETAVAARATFSTVEDCVKASTAVMGAGIPVTRIELVDERTVAAVNQYRQTDYPVVPTLFLEFQGNRGSVGQDVELARELMMDEGCEAFVFEQDERSRRQLWEARHMAALAVRASVPGKEQMVTDVCVPLSKLAKAVKMARENIDHHGITGALVGHVGDGNYHAILLVDPTDPEELGRAYEINESLVQYALSVGGTCTGEHGVGIGKRKYQETEHGEAIAVMRAIKQVLDPHNVMNPGKLID